MRAALTGCAALALLWAPAAHATDKNAPAQEADAAPAAQATTEAAAAPARAWNVGAIAYFRSLLLDEDPRNGMALIYEANVAARVFDEGTAYIAAGLYEGFTTVEGESGFLLQDTAVGLRYATPVDLGSGRELGVVHDARLYLPTSRASQNQDLYVAPMMRLVLSTEVVPGLTLGVIPHFRYRFHGTAMRYGGQANTQFDTGLRGGLDYSLDLGGAGTIDAGFSVGSVWLHRYDSPSQAEQDDAVHELQPMVDVYVDDTEQTFQAYDYEVHVGYTPVKYLTIGLGLEQGGSVLRDGVVNTYLFHRDETELVASVSGRY